MRFISVLMAAVLLAGCAGNDPDASERPDALDVFVSIAPQAWLVRQIGAEHVNVHVLLPPGVGPHNYEPTARQIVKLTDADVYFRIGVPFEQTLLAKADRVLKNVPVVDLRKGIALRKMADDEQAHAHDEHEHHHGDDPHIWMDPHLMKTMATTVADELIRLDAEQAEAYRSNLKTVRNQLETLNDELAKTLKPVEGRVMYVYHPAYGYFAQAYGLKQKAVEIEGKSPSARQLGELVDQARRDGVTTIFVQPQSPVTGAKAVAEAIDGRVVSLDPLAEDYPDNLREIAHKIRRALGGENRP